jgi:hypothetical protein
MPLDQEGVKSERMTDETEDSPRDVERFSRIEQRMALMDELRSVVGHFLSDFAVFESLYLTAALKAVSHDGTVIDYLPELMDLHYRLKLLKYLGAARKLPKPLMDDVRAVCKAADELRDHRNDIAHGAAVLSFPFLTNPESSDMVAGVQKRRSKWHLPEGHVTADEVAALHRTWLVTVPKIRECTAAAMHLQHATQQLANKLACYQRGEPWEQIVVGKVSVPKRE